MSRSAPYPRESETDVVLRDGSTVHVRPVRPSDEQGIRVFLEGVSRDAIGFRFFGAPDLKWVLSWSLDVDYVDRFALVAETGEPGRIIAHGAYVRSGGSRAEVAFLVADAWQGRGISTIMLAHLASIAEQRDIAAFTAEVLPANHRMIEVFRQSGFPVTTRSTRDAIEVQFPTSLTPEAIAGFRERERTAAIAAVSGFLRPHSIAVIGASDRRGTVGGELMANLIAGGFTGSIHPVNDHADTVQSLPAYRTVRDIPEPADLAVVAVPAGKVVAVARECAAVGVRALLVISAGFAETGGDGARWQRELVDICRAGGMRLIGPNCLGVLNTAPEVCLNATFAPRPAPPGRVGFLSQSGGVGIAIIEAAQRLGLGLSSFVSVGNKADLSSNDLLEYWEQDAGTDLALLYLESFGNPRKFARVARRFTRQKPIVAVKSGRSAAGARATSSHTGALLAASDVTVDALFQQAGVIRTETLHELFDVASLLSTQPIPGGDRVAIVTNGGGPGIICADACAANGVPPAEPSAQLKDDLMRFLPSAASLGNPFDMIASASPDDYRRTLRTLVDSEGFDAIIVIFVPALATAAGEVAAAISEVAQTAGECTIAAVFMSGDGPPERLGAAAVAVPGFAFPEDAARAVALAARHGRWRARPEGSFATPTGCRADEAAAIITHALADGSSWLEPSRVAAVLDCYGLPLVTSRGVADAVELIVGVVHDQSFGPVLACGAGGTSAELINDVSVAITPVSDLDAKQMLRSLKTFPLLDGYRGAPRCDLAAIEDVLLRISAMVQAHPAIAEMDCNPLIATPHGAVIVHARLRVEAAEAPPPVPSVRA